MLNRHHNDYKRNDFTLKAFPPYNETPSLYRSTLLYSHYSNRAQRVGLHKIKQRGGGEFIGEKW
jgi:hypothetical protein